jgi:hypothetical protein
MALEWKVESLRLSLFSSEVVKLGVDDWKALTGKDTPEIEQKVIGQHTMAGPLLEGRISLSASGSRLDCILAAPPPTDPAQTYVPVFGHWPDTWKELVGVTEPWVAGTGVPIVRMALGAVLLSPQPTLDEAYKSLLGSLKSLQGDPAKMRDLLFRVNWPVNSTAVTGLTINRLTTWAVIRLQYKVLVDTGANVLVENAPVSHFVRFEMDHNTDPRTEPFDKTRLSAIYKELMNLALENAEKGELP